ncbi:MAG: phosphoribosylamine--glycine ligase [Candidatus Omnitrophota bacterium]
MRILVVGSGGREHALVWKIAQSKLVDKIFATPGNAGISTEAECIDIKADDVSGLLNFARKEKIDLTVVGPEIPLSLGIVDEFSKFKSKIFGPNKKCAQLEASKVFAKELMAKYNVPTAAFKIFDNVKEANKYIESIGAPCVIKADGLAAGKGVIIAHTLDEAREAVNSIIEGRIFGDAGKQVIIEECLIGEEASILIFTDSKEIIPLASSQDHKRIFDGDKGPNCYSKDTEILTKNGWKRFNLLEENDEVAVFEPNSRKISFEKPQKNYWMEYKGPMVQFKHRNIDLLVTPNHRMLLQQRYRKKKIYVKEAGEYKTENYIFQSGIWGGKNQKFFILPEYDYKFNRKFRELKINFIDWVRFLGVYLSEGNTTKGKRGSKRVYISQKKSSINFYKIKRIIERLPFNFSYDSKYHKFRINSTQLATYLERFGISYEKFVPDYIKNAKKDILIGFLKAFNLGDGDIHYGKMRFFSSSKRLIDDIQEMIVKIDCSGVITVDKRKTMVNPINKKTYKARPIYSIEIKKRNKTSIRKNNFKIINYDGHVGCVTVSTGFVIVRRNNRVAISGNTGGMGAYSPAPIVTKELLNEILEKCVNRTIAGLIKEGIEYQGVLYTGIMLTKQGPKVLEFNVRFGDPETQAILPRLKSDLLEVLLATAQGQLSKFLKSGALIWDDRACVCVVCASGGYPGDYQKDKEISGLEEAEKLEDIVVFHAGTKKFKAKYLTNGGRVLGVTGLGGNIKEAIDNTYRAVDKIHFEGMHFRKDIGQRALRLLS